MYLLTRQLRPGYCRTGDGHAKYRRLNPELPPTIRHAPVVCWSIEGLLELGNFASLLPGCPSFPTPGFWAARGDRVVEGLSVSDTGHLFGVR